MQEGRSSFLNKSSKRLLIILAPAFPNRLSQVSQKFFASFFQKRSSSIIRARPTCPERFAVRSPATDQNFLLS
jgi:hypothetical protein